jgi:hypothetical protein
MEGGYDSGSGEDMMMEQEGEDPGDSPSRQMSIREPKLKKEEADELFIITQGLGQTDMCLNEKTGLEEEKFSKGEACLDFIFDLQRSIRRDQEEFRSTSKTIGSWDIVTKKLFPLVVDYEEEKPLLFAITKVLVMLTMPVSDKTRNKEELVEYNQTYKACFLNEHGALIKIFLSMLEEPISHEGKDRTDTDNLIIELIITLFRNLLSIPNPKETKHSAGDHMHNLAENMLIAFEEANVLAMFQLLASDIEVPENKDWNLLLLEVFDLIFRNHNPQKLAEFSMEKGAGRSKNDADDDLLGKLRDERTERSRISSMSSSRHSRFGGLMFVNKQGFSGDRRQLITNPFGNSARNVPQARKRRRANKELLVDTNEADRKQNNVLADTTLHRQVRRIVKDMATCLLECYVPFMRSIKGEFRRESTRLIATDRDLFFRVITFCSVFYRTEQSQKKKAAKLAKAAAAVDKDQKFKMDATAEYKGFHSGPIFETLDMFTFRQVQNEGLIAINDKKYAEVLTPVALLKEMLTFLYEMRSAGDDANRKIATALQNKVFYERDTIELLPVLVSKWEPKHSTYDHLINVVEVIHLMLKMLEAGAKGSMIILSKPKKVRKKKAKKKAKKEYDSGTEDEYEEVEVAGAQDEEMVEMQRTEQEFDFMTFFKQKFINAKAVVMYTHLLRRYKDNTTQTNHHINVYFHRLMTFPINPSASLTDDRRTLGATFEPMLFQLDVLEVFNNVSHLYSLQSWCVLCHSSATHPAQCHPLVCSVIPTLYSLVT